MKLICVEIFLEKKCSIRIIRSRYAEIFEFQNIF